MRSLDSLFGIGWTVFIAYWIISAAQSKRTLRSNTWRKGILVRIVLVAVLIIIFHFIGGKNFWIFAGQVYSHSVALDILAVILWLIGIGLAVWARVYLGKNWGMPMSLKENPELVTTGPYRYVRHPIYTGILLAVFASMIIGYGIWAIWFVVSAIYFIYSAFAEDKIMAREFPETYPAYKRRTKMLIPFIL